VWNPQLDPGLHVAILRVPFRKCRPRKRYNVDTTRKKLVVVNSDHGITFGFGRTANALRTTNPPNAAS
jgi:hypothetical protein